MVLHSVLNHILVGSFENRIHVGYYPLSEALKEVEVILLIDTNFSLVLIFEKSPDTQKYISHQIFFKI